MQGKVVLITGGARSGKSRRAETRARAFPGQPVYIATAEALDAEMAERIASHRARRGPGWQTIEAPRDLVAALKSCRNTPVLVDCLTLWLSNVMLAEADIQAEAVQLEATLAAMAAPVVLVSNEVSYGIVPDYPLGRRFRDHQGILNQKIAARADRVVLVVAGLPLAVKGAV